MTKLDIVNFDALSTDAKIAKAIKAVHDSGETLQLQIHKVLVAIATRWAKTGDIRQPVLHINALLHSDKLKGMRKNAMRVWVEKHLGFVFNEETKAFVAGRKTAKELNIKDIGNAHWWMETPEPEYTPVQPEQAMARLIAMFEKDRKKLGDASAVSPGMIEALKGMKIADMAAA